MEISSAHLHSQTVRAMELKLFHVPCVTCHVSHVQYHIFFLQNYETSWWRVCYRRATPSSLYVSTNIFQYDLQDGGQDGLYIDHVIL